jgi:hypothetical protein
MKIPENPVAAKFLKEWRSSDQPYSEWTCTCIKNGNLEKDYENLCFNYPKTVETAERLIQRLHSAVLENNWWYSDPLLNISFENEIVLEWWNKEKKLQSTFMKKS